MASFFKELEPYPKPKLRETLGEQTVNELLESGLLKAYDTEYKFNFVGVFATNSVVGCVIPKFFKNEKMGISRFKRIIQIIRKYQHENSSQYKLNSAGESVFFDKPSLQLHLIKDYIENGLYSNFKSFIEENGDGEIDWDSTINETVTIIKNKRPYYTILKTRSIKNDDEDYFKRLHKYVITQCFCDLKNDGLLELFDLPFDKLSEESEKDFGSRSYIKYRINQELHTQYITRKQELLKTLYSYFAEEKTRKTEDGLTLYGVKNFNYIWQKACACIFDDKHCEYEKKISNLRMPLWYHYKDNSFVLGDNKDNTLETDIISVSEDSKTFCILDAKNYSIEWEESEKSKYVDNPSVNDIVKQFAYHKEFLNCIAVEGFHNVVNALLFPEQESFDPDAPNDAEKGRVNAFGYVEMPIMMDWGDKWLVPIHLVYLSPSFVLMNYLNDKICKPQLKKISKLNEIRSKCVKIDLKRTFGNVKKLCCMVIQRENILEKDGKVFCYFVKGNRKMICPLHPELDKCTVLIAYSVTGECWVANVNPKDRKEMNLEGAKKEIKTAVFGIKVGTIYKLELTNWKPIVNFRRSDLERCREKNYIVDNDENEFLPIGSPKVIKISLD